MQVRIPQLFEEIAALATRMHIKSALQGSRHNCYAGDDNIRIIEHQSVVFRGLSLCNLCVLCVSVVNSFTAITHHKDTENTEVAQRNQINSRLALFEAQQAAGFVVGELIEFHQ